MILFIGVEAVSFFTFRLPPVQHWLGQTVSRILSEEMQSEVHIDKIDATSLRRPVLDGVIVLDQSGDTLLKASRMATRLRLMPLFSGNVSLTHIQLYGPDIRLRKGDDGKLNCQYIIDLLSGDGGGDGGTKLNISTIILRRGALSYNTINIRDLAATIYGLRYEDKCLSAYLRDMHLATDFVEVENLTARLSMVPESGHVSGVELTLPSSRVVVDSVSWGDDFGSWKVNGGVAHIDVADLWRLQSSSVGKGIDGSLLSRADDLLPYLDVRFDLSGSKDSLRTDTLIISGQDLHVDADASLCFAPLEADVHNMDVEWRRGEHIRMNVVGHYDRQRSDLHAVASTDYATATVDGTLVDEDLWTLHCFTNRFHPSLLAAHFDATRPLVETLGDSASISLDLNGKGRLKQRVVSVDGVVGCRSVPLVCDMSGSLDYSVVGGTQIHFKGDVDRVRPSALGAKGKLAQRVYAGGCQCDVSWPSTGGVEDAVGNVAVTGLTLLDDTLMSGPLVRNFVVDITPTSGDYRRLCIYSDFVNIHALVYGQPTDVVAHVRDMVADAMPSLVKHTSSSAARSGDSRVVVNAQVWDTNLINYLAGTDLEICDTLQLSLSVDSLVNFRVQSDSIHYGNEQLTDVEVFGRMTSGLMRVKMNVGRRMKSSTANLSLFSEVSNDTVGARLDWLVSEATDHGTVAVRLNLGDTLNIAIRPSEVMLNKAVWRVGEGRISLLPDGALDISNASFESGGRHLRLKGRMSSNPSDTLRADISDVNLGYIFDMVNFHSVELDGDITGKLRATGLTSTPRASGNMVVTNFAFNKAVLGDMNLRAVWDTDEGQLSLRGHITGPPVSELDMVGAVPSAKAFGDVPTFGGYVPSNTIITGYVNLSKDKARRGLDLDVQANGFNLGFLNMWTTDIFRDLRGCLSGHVRIFGPFNGIDLDGRVCLDHCTAHMPTLGDVTFQLGGDSVFLSPGLFSFERIELYDQNATSRSANHRAFVNGRITHNHFKNMRYDFHAQADNLLGYNTHDFGNDVFYGTAYLSGNVHLTGGPGQLDVEIRGTTMRGSQLVYNSSSPETVKSGNFITYVDNLNATDSFGKKGQAAMPTEVSASDMNLRFNIDVTPDATLRVLMDQRSGDYIELHGNAPITASYYNKGAFRMYGTYEVQRGRYRMSLSDFIRKDFTFREGGTITFPGTPANATLNLQALYTVSGVSLNDLAASATFSSARTRVNCLLNLTGTADAPQVSFDFDLPNASQDEVAMVKSLVSTDEERNLQAIYLLGLGTFYVQDNADTQTRGNMAVNSFLSSTLSSQINSVLGDAIGNKNWSFGTNISTGQMGWSEVQAEGSLSGRLFHDRLLVNGTFGYREGGANNPAQTGFVGDFDVQWLLTRTGTVSVKAYSQTTDRYFTKSALTTQGLGIVLKKDFNNLRELFGKKKISVKNND